MTKHSIVRVVLLAAFSLAVGCGDDGPLFTMPGSYPGDTGDAEVSGRGGSGSSSSTWQNNQSRAEFCFDHTGATTGSVQMIFEDADGVVVADRTLTVGVGDDSTCALTDRGGVAGAWTVTIVVVDFDGDATFSWNSGT